MGKHYDKTTANFGAVFLTLVFSLAVTVNAQAAVYKYQDANGRWQFSDKPPKDKNTKAETLKFKASPSNPMELKFQFDEADGLYTAKVTNPFYIPIEIRIRFEDKAKLDINKVIPSTGELTIYSGVKPSPHFNYRYLWGDPDTQQTKVNYHIPINSPSRHKITQSFNGRFSHNQQPSLYAVDIGLPIGTDIAAARAGTVIFVKDDYAFGGAKRYFLDKANSVSVLHKDGTYATYAHLLLGSATVKPGQSVAAGDILGQSGTSGFSTGPHLHFVVRKNTGFKTESVRFKFEDARGVFTPKRNQFVCPCPSQ